MIDQPVKNRTMIDQSSENEKVTEKCQYNSIKDELTDPRVEMNDSLQFHCNDQANKFLSLKVYRGQGRLLSGSPNPAVTKPSTPAPANPLLTCVSEQSKLHIIPAENNSSNSCSDKHVSSHRFPLPLSEGTAPFVSQLSSLPSTSNNLSLYHDSQSHPRNEKYEQASPYLQDLPHLFTSRLNQVPEDSPHQDSPHRIFPGLNQVPEDSPYQDTQHRIFHGLNQVPED